MVLKVKPNDDTGLWEIHDECGHLCNLESESTAQDITQAVNRLPQLVGALRVMQQRLDNVANNGCCMKYADAVGGEAGVLISDREMIQDALAAADNPSPNVPDQRPNKQSKP